MAWAALWDLVAGSSLLLGAAAGLRRPPDNGGFDAVGNGLVLGALAFTAGDAVIERRGGGDRKRSAGQQEGGSALAIAFGAALDGLPESIVFGAGLALDPCRCRSSRRCSSRTSPNRSRPRSGCVGPASPPVT